MEKKTTKKPTKVAKSTDTNYNELLSGIVGLIKGMQENQQALMDRISNLEQPKTVKEEEPKQVEVESKVIYEVVGIFDGPEYMMTADTIGTYPTLEEAKDKIEELNATMLGKVVERGQFKLRYKKFQINSSPIKFYKDKPSN